MKRQDAAFFHEDNYCQIELLPINNLFVKRSENNLIQEHAKQNYIDNGFIEISSREQTPYPLTELRIDFNSFKAIFKEDALFYFDNVYTGYSTERILKKSIQGFGFENYILYYEFEAAIITNCWIDYTSLSDTLNCYPEKLQMLF